MNGKNLLNETANTMAGLSFPGNKAEFVTRLFLGKYDRTSASNLEAFQVSILPMFNAQLLRTAFTHADPKYVNRDLGS